MRYTPDEAERVRMVIILIGMIALITGVWWFSILFLIGTLPLLWWTREPVV